jgi:hypothetical protein
MTETLDKTLSCFNYNFDALAVADATNSYLIIYAGISNNTNNGSRHGMTMFVLTLNTFFLAVEELGGHNNDNNNDIPTFQYPMLLYVYPVGSYNFENNTVPDNLKPSGKPFLLFS